MSVENIVVDIEINNSLAPDIEQSLVATIDNNINVIKDNTDDLDVTINRKEYVITGDEIYIPKRYEDAPTWLQNMIDQVVEYSIGAKVSDMNQVVYSLNQMIEAMEVSKNTYEMSVISSNDIDTRINTAITTLNSNMNDADATILSVANTKTTPEEAEAIMINAVRAELESTEAGTIGAAVATLSTAIANEEEARSTSVETLYSTMEGEFEATATAFNTINTYIGIDEAGASTGTGLSGYLEGTDGQIGSAGSKLINDVALKAGEVENKFAYNSTIKLNGVTHNSGFGLATSINSASIPEGDSQFWVSANEFKVVGANQTADAQGPFTVNTITGDITFNGEVTFNAVDAVYADTIVDNTANNNDLFAQRLGYMDYSDMVASAESGQTIINGGYLRGELIEANSINAGQIDAYAITGKHISGGTITGTHIIGSVIKGSYIDLTSTLVLTNWQYYTPATIPVGYEANFAHHNDGSLTVDSQGYVRLAGQQNFIIPPIVQSGTISGSETRQINKTYDLYSWDSYTINTLQRGIRADTSFTSTAELVITSSGGSSGASGNHVYNSSCNFRFLDKDIDIYVGASGNNSHVAAVSQINFNGSVVAYSDGSLGVDLSKPWDSGWIDFSTTIKGIPINIKTTISGAGETTFEFKATLSGLNSIVGHSNGDVIRINSISQSGSDYSKNLTYNINFPSVWVQ